MILETDTSDYAIAGILSLCYSDEEIRLVTYFSWTLSASELNYNTHDKELLAIHESFQTWCHYSKALLQITTIFAEDPS
jgi:hypothetical protein